MATRARLSQERSRQRREQLLDAAIELFAEGGSRGITHRAVAARAGLPPATTTYYFTSIEELIDEALERHVDIWLQDLNALAAVELPDDLSFDGAGALISAAFAIRSTDVVCLQLSVYLAAARNPDLRVKAAEALSALEALTARMLRSAGVLKYDQLAHSIMAVIAGSALSRISKHWSDEDEAAKLYRAILGLVASSMLSDDEIASKLQELNPGS